MTCADQFDLIDNAWKAPIQSSYFKIGLSTVRIISDTLFAKKMTHALDHLRIESPNEYDFTVCLWDMKNMNQKLPKFDWDILNQNGYKGVSCPPVYLHYFESIDALSLINTQKKRAHYVVKDAKSLPWWVEASPLQVIINVMAQEKGVQLAHTAAIGNEAGAVLLTGKGGSGKSTTTLTCLREGFHYIGEDYCLLQPGETPYVYSLYQSAKWEKNTRILYPEYEPYIQNTEVANSEKALVYYQDIFPKKIKIASPVCAIISLNRESNKHPKLERATNTQALKDLMMSTLFQLPLYHPKSMSVLKSFVSKVDCYNLTLGTNLKENALLIQNILEKKSQNENRSMVLSVPS